MRIAFLNRGRETHPGGDVIALDATMAALRRKGVECEETGWDIQRISKGDFDLCHIFHCNFDWSWGNRNAVWECSNPTATGRMPYVLTPVFYPGLRCGVNEAQIRKMVWEARIVLPFSRAEGDEMRRELGWFPYEAVPNGTDPRFHCLTPAREREGVLCVSARGADDKGIPRVRAACEKLKLPFTCVTGVSHEELPAIYAQHRVFVNASDSERMSLTVGEALAAGCRVMCTKGNRGNEWYGSKFPPAIPTDKDCFLHQHLYYLYMYGDDDTEAHRLARSLTWDYVADKLIEVYRWCS